MLKIGMSSCGFELNEKSFIKLNEAGVENIEISLPYGKTPELNFKKVKTLADKYGVNIWSYHLPFGDCRTADIASLDEEIRTKTVEYWSELIKKGSEIGINKFVAHPSSEPKSEDTETRKREKEQAKRSLCELATAAEENGGVIAVENLPRTCLGRTTEEILELVSADPRLRICFDTNHALIEDLYEFCERIADRIITVHVSDYDRINERHWLPGEGTTDWHRLYKALTENGYNGVWMYEVRLTAPETITRAADLTPEDFIRNANEIFGNKKLTVLGVPKENLGMW